MSRAETLGTLPPGKMWAIVWDKEQSEIKDLKLKQVDIPEPGIGEVRVRVAAASLNPVDYKLFGWGPRPLPHVLGLDVAGVVDKIGAQKPDVQLKHLLHVGDRVHFMGAISNPHGGFAQYAIASQHMVIPIPQDVDFITAAALPVASWTAWLMIHSKARVKSGETVVVTAGAGGVGGFAVQFAHLAGCRVIATCSAQNSQYVRSIGADETVDYTHEDVIARIQQLTHGRGADFWIELAGPESAASAFQAVAFNGMLVSAVGSPDISNALKQGEIFHRGQGLSHVMTGGVYNADLKAQFQILEVGENVLELVRTKKVNVKISQIVPLQEIPASLERLKTGHISGKIVAKISD